MTGWAVPVALAAAGCFSTSLQQSAASGAAPEATRGRLLAYPCRRRVWLNGLAAGAARLALHGLALRLGALIVVLAEEQAPV